MKLGIMQPYFFPYIGYFQLMNAVDKYVIYDDVNFIKGGWINRNRILLNGQPFMINLPMKGASSFKKINEIEIDLSEVNKRKIKTTLYNAYRKAPNYPDFSVILNDILDFETNSLSEFLINSIKKIAGYLDMKTEFIVSSSLEKDNELKGKDKVISICKLLGATEYYNAIGGQELYSFDEFKENGIDLKFLKTNEIEYKQFDNEFQSSLSIIDLLMFNSKEQAKQMLNEFQLISGE